MMAMEEFAFIDNDSTTFPPVEYFRKPTIPQRFLDEADTTKIVHLTEEDYQEVAQELKVEVAAIKAIVDIETGRLHTGFNRPRNPIIDFDAKIFARFCARKGINLKARTSQQDILYKRGFNQVLEHQRLSVACAIDSITAFESTFWGMFQIGGFNWKLCGAQNIQHFVKEMCYSERSQLKLFANFITNTDLVKYLRAKNWRAFAKRYNGPKYAQHGYHTRLAAAYRKHSEGCSTLTTKP